MHGPNSESHGSGPASQPKPLRPSLHGSHTSGEIKRGISRDHGQRDGKRYLRNSTIPESKTSPNSILQRAAMDQTARFAER